MVVFDATTIVLTIDPTATPPNGPDGNPVPNCRERIEHLLSSLSKSKTPIIIPTPVVAEYLVGAGPNKMDYLNTFLNSKNFEVAPFDLRAAIDLSDLIDPDFKAKRLLDPTLTKAKIKFDRQIIAIAKSRRASRIYTDDGNMKTVAERNGVAVTMTWEIPLPPEVAQQSLKLDPEGNGSR